MFFRPEDEFDDSLPFDQGAYSILANEFGETTREVCDDLRVPVRRRSAKEIADTIFKWGGRAVIVMNLLSYLGIAPPPPPWPGRT